MVVVKQLHILETYYGYFLLSLALLLLVSQMPLNKTLLRALFLALLPMEAHRILTGSSTTDLNDLAKETDAIME